EELRLAEFTRAVRDAHAQVGIAPDAEVYARVNVVEEPPVAAVVRRLVAQLHGGNLLGIRQAAADGDAGAHVFVPRKAIPVSLEEGHQRPEVVLVGLLEVALRADEAGELHRPAV